MNLIKRTFDDPAAFWSAVAAIVALISIGSAFLGAKLERRAARRERAREAKLVLEAIGDELIWIHEVAEAVIKGARRALNHSPRSDPVTNATLIHPRLTSDELDAMEALSSLDFPVFGINAEILRSGDPEDATAIATGYGQLYRVRADAARLRSKWEGLNQPLFEHLKPYDQLGGRALAAADRTYRYIADAGNLRVPKHWEPRAELVSDEDVLER